MKSEPQPAYLNLINQLLTCPSGEEQEILNTHPELLDDGLVAAMLEKADNLREQGELNNANWLKDFAGLLGDFLAGIALKPEADRLLEQGNQQYAISQVREALQSWEQALTIYRKIEDREGEANSLGNLGIAYDSLGQYQNAIDFHQQSLEIEREIGNRQGEAASLGNLGAAYDSLGQYQKAIDFHQQYLKIAREIGDRLGESISLNNLGNTLLKTNQLAEAETVLRASIQICETLRSELVNNDHKASIFETQVKSYLLMQQILVAQTKFDQALEISEMSRTRAFVELLQQTLLTTPPQSPPYQGGEVDKSSPYQGGK